MKQDALLVGKIVSVHGHYNEFIPWWRGRVVDTPSGGNVRVQRISVIDSRDMGEPVTVTTRSCDEPNDYSLDARVREEKHEAMHLSQRDAVMAALSRMGVLFETSPWSPEIKIHSNGFEALLKALGAT